MWQDKRFREIIKTNWRSESKEYGIAQQEVVWAGSWFQRYLLEIITVEKEIDLKSGKIAEELAVKNLTEKVARVDDQKSGVERSHCHLWKIEQEVECYFREERWVYSDYQCSEKLRAVEGAQYD